MKEVTLKKILRFEWEMFSLASNAGGQAPCQSDPATFEIMRASQLETWPEELLESWLADLAATQLAGRNLMSEKYAWMMESTHPDAFKKIAHLLPLVDNETLALVERIVAANVLWKLEIADKYPVLGAHGRAVRTGEDSPWDTSFETYLRGELKTYSPETVRRLLRHTQKLLDEGINGVEQVLLNQVKKYGYTSLADAESAQAQSPAAI